MSVTYIVQIDGPEKLVKFGRSNNFKGRFSTLQTSVPWPLRLVALIGSDIERDLKKQFAGDRVHGEWFRPSAALQEWLKEAAAAGMLVRRTTVDKAYINAVIKPRIREYLNGREPTNSSYGDLVRCIFADLLPSLETREGELVRATKGHVTLEICRGYGPTNEVPELHLSEGSIVASGTA